MTVPSRTHITELLVAWSGGDRGALDRLLPLVYDELHRLAGRQLRRERRAHPAADRAGATRPTCGSSTSATPAGRAGPTSSASPPDDAAGAGRPRPRPPRRQARRRRSALPLEDADAGIDLPAFDDARQSTSSTSTTRSAASSRSTPSRPGW